MFRKRNGSRSFSFTRLANTIVPNFFEDTSPTTTSSLAGLRKDMCYAHQLSSPNPFALDERSFYVAGVADNEAVSKKIYKALKRHGVLRADDYDDGGGKGEVDTRKIGQGFIHQLASINVMRQRELINMLFWWEEETQRLKKLVAEEKELDVMIEASEQLVAAQERRERRQERRLEQQRQEESQQEENERGAKERLDQLKFARERIRMKKRQRPSQRRADVEADKDNLMEAFYGSRSAPLAQTSGGVQDSGKPPEYYASG
ncbi:hypothetical protein DV735_g4964, partial [Chaetothyriales sp. CBS 134920]